MLAKSTFKKLFIQSYLECLLFPGFGFCLGGFMEEWFPFQETPLPREKCYTINIFIFEKIIFQGPEEIALHLSDLCHLMWSPELHQVWSLSTDHGIGVLSHLGMAPKTKQKRPSEINISMQNRIKIISYVWESGKRKCRHIGYSKLLIAINQFIIKYAAELINWKQVLLDSIL